MEYSTFFIKPEASNSEKDILALLRRKWFTIVHYERILLKEEILRNLYARLLKDEEHLPLWAMTKQQLANKGVTAGIVEGTNAVQRLVALCGESIDPANCGVQTIRRAVAGGIKGIRCGKHMFWRNGIHCARSHAGVTNEISLFFPNFRLPG